MKLAWSCSTALLLVVAIAGCSDNGIVEPKAAAPPQFDFECTTFNCEEAPEIPFSILEAYTVQMPGPQLVTRTVTSHVARLEGQVVIARDSTTLQWPISLDDSHQKTFEKALDHSAPCSVGVGPLRFASVHEAEKIYAMSLQDDSRTDYTSLLTCDAERTIKKDTTTEVTGMGSTGDPYNEPIIYKCDYLITFWEDTGEIISRQLLQCYSEPGVRVALINGPLGLGHTERQALLIPFRTQKGDLKYEQ